MEGTKSLSPVFKWTGGKRKELPIINQYLPKFVNDNKPWKYVEPFVGGGALYFALANPNSHINDLDEELTNFLMVMAVQDERFLREVNRMAALFQEEGITSDEMAQAYYSQRNADRSNGLSRLPEWKRAARFYIVNQLAFSGMRRFNSKGEFNIPFGHYKRFNPEKIQSLEHVKLLASTEITCGSYEGVLENNDKTRTFIFIDPPYTRVMKTYTNEGEFGDEDQQLLSANLIALKKASWMVVIDKSDLTEKLYEDYIVHTYKVNYGANIKNRFSQAAEHIIACNYQR